MKYKYISIMIVFILSLYGFNIKGQTLLFEEDFDLATASELAGQNGWSVGISLTNKVMIGTEGLSYPNYITSATSKAAVFTAPSDRVQNTFTGTLTDNYYYAFLLNVSSAGSGDFFAGFFSSGAFRGRVYLKASESEFGFHIGLVKTTSGTPEYSPVELDFNTTHLIVVKYEFVEGTTNDKVSLFLNPDFSAAEPVPTIGPLTDDGNDVNANVFAVQGRENAGSFTMDGIKIAASWAELKGEEYDPHKPELPRFISSHMVLQRDTPMKFFGWGVPSDELKVDFVREGQTFSASTTVGENGKWNVELPAQTACAEPCKLTFYVPGYADAKIELDDILIGDVWFSGGQSNMEKKVSHLLEAEQYIEEADSYPLIRGFRASYNVSATPQEKVNASTEPWFVCNSAQVGNKVSAVSYVFARDVFDEIDVPIGIMQSYRGGTELETWMSPMKFSGDPELCKISGRDTYLAPENRANSHSVNYNGQIHPLIGYPLKGFLWYQGESNTKRAPEYRFMMKKLIEDWRERWGMGDLPFYYVQMFNVTAASEYEGGSWPELRDQQAQLLVDKSVPNTGMCVIIDTNEDPTNSDGNIRMHPRNKKPAGERLARIALKNTYGVDLLAEGPILNRYKFDGSSVYLYFKNCGDGLKIRDGESLLKGFAVCGADRNFRPAVGIIVNDSTVMVRSGIIQNPISVRYAWARNPICNLYNSIDIPACPFRTDDWDLTPYDQPQSSCSTQSADATLATVRFSGKVFDEFNANQTIYNIYWEDMDNLPVITSVTNNPFAKAIISESTTDKIAVRVTAENGTIQTYEFKFSVLTSNQDIANNIPVKIYKNGNVITVDNQSDEVLTLHLYSISGQHLQNDTVAENQQKNYAFESGFVLLEIKSESYSVTRKFYF